MSGFALLYPTYGCISHNSVQAYNQNIAVILLVTKQPKEENNVYKKLFD